MKTKIARNFDSSIQMSYWYDSRVYEYHTRITIVVYECHAGITVGVYEYHTGITVGLYEYHTGIYSVFNHISLYFSLYNLYLTLFILFSFILNCISHNK